MRISVAPRRPESASAAAQDQGVLVAFHNTVQGEEGWYASGTGDATTTAYFVLDKKGAWHILFPAIPTRVLLALLEQARRSRGLVLVPSSAAQSTPYYVAADANVFAYSGAGQPADELGLRATEATPTTPAAAAAPASPSALVGLLLGRGRRRRSVGPAPALEPCSEGWSSCSESSSGDDDLRSAMSVSPADEGRRRGGEEEGEEADVLQALPGTVQGQSGWYASAGGGSVAFFDADGEGAWDMLVGPMSARAYRALLSEASASRVLVPCPGTEAGEEGWYMDRGGGMAWWEREAAGGEWARQRYWKPFEAHPLQRRLRRRSAGGGGGAAVHVHNQKEASGELASPEECAPSPVRAPGSGRWAERRRQFFA